MDLAADNIRVNGVCPGAIHTSATDRHIASLGLDPEQAYADFGKDALLKRLGKPEEIAAGVLFLASDESSFMTGTNRRQRERLQPSKLCIASARTPGRFSRLLSETTAEADTRHMCHTIVISRQQTRTPPNLEPMTCHALHAACSQPRSSASLLLQHTPHQRCNLPARTPPALPAVTAA
jgi:hypothetical protein